MVALSQDSNPKELSEVRKLVEKTSTSKKISLTGNPVGLIGLDPSGSVGKAFEVEGFPTLVVLDGKGVVQSAHVGIQPRHPREADNRDRHPAGREVAGQGEGRRGLQEAGPGER